MEQQKLFMFKSGRSTTLGGFTIDAGGKHLPGKFAPWTGIGVVRAEQPAPHGLSRPAIEAGIAAKGYQLWRTKKA